MKTESQLENTIDINPILKITAMAENFLWAKHCHRYLHTESFNHIPRTQTSFFIDKEAGA